MLHSTHPDPPYVTDSNCLSGTKDPRVSVIWVPTQEKLRTPAPVELHRMGHVVWGACEDGQTFIGGASLFGRIIAEIHIQDFGSKLPGAYLPITYNWLTQ